MNISPHYNHRGILQMGMSEFWSDDLGLTPVSISLVILIFIVFPLREAGLPGRIFFDLLIVTLMIMGTLAVDPFARSLATAEAITGQLFPAILIGALVVMAIQSNAKP